MSEVKPSWRRRFVDARGSLAAGVVIVLALAGIAAWLVGGNLRDAARIGGYFVAGLFASLVSLTAVAWLLLKGLQMFVRRWPWKLPTALRHGMANLYRPGSQAQSVLTALGVGVMFTLTIYLVQRSVLDEIATTAPPGMANVFLLDISAPQRANLESTLTGYKGIERKPEIVSTVAAKLVAVNGSPLVDLKLQGPARRFRSARSITTATAKPQGTEVLRGAWWTGTPETARVSVSEGAAKALDIEPGAVLEWQAYGREIRAMVSSIHRTDFQRLGSTIEFVMSPGVIENLPTVYYGAVRVKPDQVAQLQRILYERYPTVTVVNMADVVERVREVVDQIAVIVRFVSLFAIFAGATILASSVAGTRFRRVREVVILKTLGATRGRIARIFSAEFLILGTVAGLMGTLLATGFAALVLKRLLNAELRFEWPALAIAVALTAIVATGVGWLASYRILGQKPLEVLRGE
jgi:putative ABC transport system permease protein